MDDLERTFFLSRCVVCGHKCPLENAGQRSCGCLLPGIIQDQVGWGFENAGLMEDIPAHGNYMIFKVLPNQTIL